MKIGSTVKRVSSGREGDIWVLIGLNDYIYFCGIGFIRIRWNKPCEKNNREVERLFYGQDQTCQIWRPLNMDHLK